MSDNPPFLMLDQACDQAVQWASRRLMQAGLQVVCTFNLHQARHDPLHCPCRCYGAQDCDCQMVVLLVYGAAGSRGQPLSLVAHSYDGQTRFSVVDTAQQHADPALAAAIRRSLEEQAEESAP